MPSILITGASAGIGRATAERFLDAGLQVGLLTRRGEALASLAAGRANALALKADVTEAAEVEAAFASAVATFGRLDVLFNNDDPLPSHARLGYADTTPVFFGHCYSGALAPVSTHAACVDYSAGNARLRVRGCTRLVARSCAQRSSCGGS